MSNLGQIVQAVERYNQFVGRQIDRARTESDFGKSLIKRWRKIKENIEPTHSPTAGEPTG